jgi:hypothetical protein
MDKIILVRWSIQFRLVACGLEELSYDILVVASLVPSVLHLGFRKLEKVAIPIIGGQEISDIGQDELLMEFVDQWCVHQPARAAKSTLNPAKDALIGASGHKSEGLGEGDGANDIEREELEPVAEVNGVWRESKGVELDEQIVEETVNLRLKVDDRLH